MRGVRLEVERVALTLNAPYSIAYETIDHAENVFIRLVTDGPHVGLGVAAADVQVTGETVDDAYAALTGRVAAAIPGCDPLRRQALLEGLDLEEVPAARAALDMALHDLLAKTAGLPVWRLLGGYRTEIATSVTLFIEPVEETVRRGKDFVAQGFQALKLKGGRNVQEDIERILALRAAVGPHIQLRFDANQGFMPEDARVLYRATRDADLAMFEQPTPAAALHELRQVSESVALPIMADESILSLADVFLFARGDAMDMVNLKLPKVGGLDAALLMNGVARAAGLEVMVGCMDEAALSIASGLAFALSRKNVEFADLDGHLDFVDDPTAGCVLLRKGMLKPLDAPGFGVVDFD